jgi:hypothetical protein
MRISTLIFSLLFCLVSIEVQGQSESSEEREEIQKEEFKHPQEKIEDDEKIHGFFEERELQQNQELLHEQEREIISPAEPPIED